MTLIALNKGVSPAKVADAIGHDLDYVYGLINCGELPARDERKPGAKRPLYRINPDDVIRWQESRIVKPKGVQVRQPQLQLPRAVGLMERMRRKRAARQKQRAAARVQG